MNPCFLRLQKKKKPNLNFMHELNEADRIVLVVYKFVMPFIGAALVFVLGMIARWMRSVGKDLRIIREAMVKHETIRDEHGKRIEKLQDDVDGHGKDLTGIKVKIGYNGL